MSIHVLNNFQYFSLPVSVILYNYINGDKFISLHNKK